MHTAWHRVNAVFTYFATIAAALCALTALVDVLVSPATTAGGGGGANGVGGGGASGAAAAAANAPPPWPPASLTVREVRRLAPVRAKHDQALLGGIALDADLRRAFNWNTKQLFVTLRAEYATPLNALNQVVLWDAVVASRPAARLKLPDLKQEYPFMDQGMHLRGATVNLTLAWNVMPRVGALREGSLTFPAAVVMPLDYTAGAAPAGGAEAGGAPGGQAGEEEGDEEGEGLEDPEGEEEDEGEDEYGED